MRTEIPEKLLRIADEIEERGDANVTRLTVLKKWFERPYRLASFAVSVANRASGRKGKTIGEAAELFRQARALLSTVPILNPMLELKEAELLHARLKAFQDEHKKGAWGSVRMVKNHNLFLIEEGLRIYLWSTGSPSDGYRLAVNYCEHYDPRYGNSLNGPSLTKLREIVRFMFTIEALEDHHSEGG